MSYDYSEDKLIEQTTLDLFHNRLGWDIAIAFNSETYGEDSSLGRLNRKEVILKRNFLAAIRELNPKLPDEAYLKALEKLSGESSFKSLAEHNHEKYNLLRNGIPVDFMDEKGKHIKNKSLRVFDFDDQKKNSFLAVSQLWIEGKSHRERRPDIIGFVNGIPLLFIELKAVHKKLEHAYNNNLTDYKDVIPSLFYYNAFIILSNGIESRIGSITSKYGHFNEWKRITEDEEGVVALDKIITGVCERSRFLDLFENFILFDSSLGSVTKLIARNHQFLGVNKAIENLRKKEELFRENGISAEEKQKMGVFWHTQGSGKSYSMVFMCQKIHRKFTGSYTFLIVTDRKELETQIYGTFGATGAIPFTDSDKKNSIKASSGEDLEKLLEQDHRYLFTLIYKFNFSTPVTKRGNIIVISDEAHRTQGGSLALNMRNVIPNASFMGFTGTPLIKGTEEQLTKKIFGDYISKYDFKRSVEDGSTVPLYYENRGDHLKIKNPELNQQIREAIDQAEDIDSDQLAHLEKLFAREYPVLTAQKRLDAIAKDVVSYFCNRGYKGKGMFVALDKITAVKMYNLIKEHWDENITKMEKDISSSRYGDQEMLEKARELKWIKETEICVVVSPEMNEIKKFKAWGFNIEPHREKMNDPSRDLEKEFKDDNHPFRLVIVCAMWITGFDVPTLSTMYIDKPLKSHTLMQTIARANRVSEGKNNGTIVDYIETYNALIDALAIYGTGSSGGDAGDVGEPPVKPKEELVKELEQALSNIETFLLDEVNYDLSKLVDSSGLDRIKEVGKGVEAVSTNDNTKYKFQILAREVFRKYKAVMPDTVLIEFRDRKNAIDAIYSYINDKIESSDITDIIKRIQDVVDNSIDNLSVKEPSEEKVFDISGLDFTALEKKFRDSSKKNTVIQSIKDRIEKRLKAMVDRNPIRADLYKLYQKIIDEYNAGKDDLRLEKTFRDLYDFVIKMSKEEAETKKEGLTEEQKAIFDILRKPQLTEEEKKKVKGIAVEMLDELKKDKLRIEKWSEKTATSAAVFTTVSKTLFNRLPYPTYNVEDVDLRAHLVYEHVKQRYFGNGYSIYGPY